MYSDRNRTNGCPGKRRKLLGVIDMFMILTMVMATRKQINVKNASKLYILNTWFTVGQ